MPPKAKSSRAGKAPSSETPQRRSTRAKAPPAKSPYVEPSSGDDEDVSDFASKEGVSDYENNDAYHSAPETSAESQHKEEEVEEIVVPKKRARAPTNASRPTKKNRQGEGEVFFPYRAPTPGDVEYADDRIHPNTLTFLEGT